MDPHVTVDLFVRLESLRTSFNFTREALCFVLVPKVQ